MCRLLCNANIEPFFDYAFNAWYPNINKNLKMRWQATKSKWIRFSLKLNDRSSIKSKDFKKVNSWKSIRVCSQCSVYKFFTKNCANYFDEMYVSLETDGIHMHSLYQKLNVLHRKTNVEQKVWSYIGPWLWSK